MTAPGKFHFLRCVGVQHDSVGGRGRFCEKVMETVKVSWWN